MVEVFTGMADWQMAFLVLAAGLAGACVGRILVTFGLRLLRFDRMCERSGTTAFLRRGGITLTPAELVGRGVFWLILLAVLLEAARLLNFEVATELRRRVIEAVPALISAGLLLAVGLSIIVFLSEVVKTFMKNAGNPYAHIWAKAAKWAGAALVVILAVEQANLKGTILSGMLCIAFSSVALGCALAFGLGCKDMARQAMERWMEEMRERHREASGPDMDS